MLGVGVPLVGGDLEKEMMKHGGNPLGHKASYTLERSEYHGIAVEGRSSGNSNVRRQDLPVASG